MKRSAPMHTRNPPAARPPPAEGEVTAPRRVHSHELFEAAREVEIHHHGEVYRLRHTSTGKLILTK
jgi:hemin uptake protein HemP